MKNSIAGIFKCILFLVSLAAPISLGTARGDQVTRGPYLQMATPTSIVVRWRTDLADDSRVRYGTQVGSLSSTKDGPSNTTEHEVAISGLTPNTRYYYSIGTAGGALASGSDYGFFTPPVPGTIQAVRIWVIGDSGKANQSQLDVYNSYLAYTADRYTDVWLMLGDNAYNKGTDDDYQNGLFNVYPSLLRQTALWPTLGNHDTAEILPAPPTLPYFQMFTLPANAQAGGVASGTEYDYSFDQANIHFICLDSMASDRSPSGAMATWLSNDLAANTRQWTIAFWHHPPYSKGAIDSDIWTECIEMRGNIVPILENYGVDLVLGGHSHDYERSYLIDGHYGAASSFNSSMIKNGGNGRADQDGVYAKSSSGSAAHQGAVYAVAGNAADLLDGPLNHPAMFISLLKLGSMVLDINGIRLDARMINTSGGTEDYFTLTKPSAANNPPTVSLTSPASGASFTAPASITLQASASDGDGSISKVEFFSGSTKLGEDATTPYTFSWTGVAAGSYSLTAKATDNLGATKTSSAVNITVGAANSPPTVSLTAPTNGKTYTAPASVTLQATASDSGGSVSKVEFYSGSTKLGQDTTSPYSFSWTGVPAGSYALTAKATDNLGASTTSSTVNITVGSANIAPTVSLTSPADGAIFTTPASMTLQASASDSDGSVSLVEFYSGATKLGQAASSPYNFLWTNVTVGNYTLTAKATDNAGASTTSSAVGVTVNPTNTGPVTLTTSLVSYWQMEEATGAVRNDSVGSNHLTQFNNVAQVTGKIGKGAGFTPASSQSLRCSGNNFIFGNTSFTIATWVKLNQQGAGDYELAVKYDEASQFDWDLNYHDATQRFSWYVGSSSGGTGIDASNIGAVTTGTWYLVVCGYDKSAGNLFISVNGGAKNTKAWTTGTYGSGAGYLHFGTGDRTSKFLNGTMDEAAIWNRALSVDDISQLYNSGAGKTITGSADVSNNPPTVSLTSPANGATFTGPANITLQATAADSDGTVSLVEFYSGNNKLGQAVSSPYNFVWTNVPAGSYSLTAKATDNQAASTISGAVSVSVSAANIPPTVSLTSPGNGANFTAPASVALQAAAADSDGTVSLVEFYSGVTKIGQATVSPYAFSWNNVAAGGYVLTAKATDNLGSNTVSSPINITVGTPNSPPTVSLTSPLDGTTFSAPAAMTLQATANDSDGSVSLVEFYAGAVKIGQAASIPYVFAWSNVTSGSYVLTAKATDNLGASASSTAVNITVGQLNNPPTVGLTSPSNGATFTAPASIPLQASASDTGGTVTLVEFFAGTTKLGQSTVSPYTLSWSNVAAGIYTLTARATDNLGASATSSTISVTVNSTNAGGSSLNTGLVSYWKMEEATGATRNDSIGTNNLTQYNNVAQVAGKVTNGAGFASASKQSLRCVGNNFIFGTNSFTMAFWLKLNQQGAGDYDLAVKYDEASQLDWELYYHDATKYINWYLGSPSGATTVDSRSFGAMTAGVWYLVVCGYDKTAGNIFVSINGAARSTAAWTAGTYKTGAGFLHFATGDRNSKFLNGTMDEIGVWNKALSAAEVTELYNGGVGKTRPF